ncbi:MAG: LamG domain-containing protein, partial [Verrucomicrobia bacterium]|nr:LamG domain-containing protein [Verrucomicrobiota bacterium]
RPRLPLLPREHLDAHRLSAPRVCWTEGVWTHVAVIFNRVDDTITLLKDGVPVAEAPNEQDLEYTAAPVYVGPTPRLPFGIFEGAIDEVRIWTVARTVDEIARDRSSPLDRAEPGLAAAWSFCRSGR